MSELNEYERHIAKLKNENLTLAHKINELEERIEKLEAESIEDFTK